MIMIHSNFISGMHGYRDNKVSLQAGYDVIVISPSGGASRDFYDGFWKSDHGFLIVINSNCLINSEISPLGGVSGEFFMAESERPTMTSS